MTEEEIKQRAYDAAVDYLSEGASDFWTEVNLDDVDSDIDYESVCEEMDRILASLSRRLGIEGRKCEPVF